MADQHHDAVPTASNSIIGDVADISEALSFHWDLLQILLGLPNLTTLADVSPPGPQRSKFSYVDADTITIGPGVYFHDGTARQTVFWDADITFDLGSGGSNAASDDIDAGAQAVHYIYLDDSAIVTQASPELDADCFLNTDVTAPTWSDAKHGWYNGSDRCIFAVLTNASNQVVKFFHDGGEFVCYADPITDRAAAALSNTWTDLTLSIPAFCTVAEIYHQANYVDANAYSQWRTNGDTTGTHTGAYIDTSPDQAVAHMKVVTDSSQIIEIRFSAAGNNSLVVNTQGWYIPTGM
jgi:hypothetical protein